MVKVIAQDNSSKTTVMGHGITVSSRFELSPGIFVSPISSKIDLNLEEVSSGCDQIHEYAAVITMAEMATFALEIEDASGGKSLATKTWNSLWLFHLLSLASLSPCFSLYCVSHGTPAKYSIANRNYIIRPLVSTTEVSLDELNWAQRHTDQFDGLIGDKRFGTALRYYGNAHYLLDVDARIMLLWAGIECLLNIDAELSRRLALHAAIMHEGTTEEKHSFFLEVKKAYGVRSKVVHGSAPKPEKLEQGYAFASKLLSQLLRKCVEMGRVPSAQELDALAASSSISV